MTVEIAVGKAFMWTFVGFCLGLAVVELTDGKPAKKVDYYKANYYQVRYIYRPFPSGYQHYDYNNHGQDTFNNQRPNNSGGSRGGEPTRITPTVERGETHTGNVPQNDRKKN